MKYLQVTRPSDQGKSFEKQSEGGVRAEAGWTVPGRSGTILTQREGSCILAAGFQLMKLCNSARQGGTKQI